MNRKFIPGTGLAITACLTGALLTSCSSEESHNADYAGICVDPQTQERVDDSRCPSGQNSSSGMEFFWAYILLSSMQNNQMPAVGGRVTNNYVTQVPAGKYAVQGGIPKSGGKLANQPQVKVDKSGNQKGYEPYKPAQPKPAAPKNNNYNKPANPVPPKPYNPPKPYIPPPRIK